MFVHYIDMGQGLATILQFPKGVVMIDAGSQIMQGRGESRRKVNDYLETFFSRFPQYNKTIDAIIVTHNQQDHTGTIPDIYENYTIKNLVTTKFNKGDDVMVRGVKKFYVKYRPVLKKLPNGLNNSSIDPLQAMTELSLKLPFIPERILRGKAEPRTITRFLLKLNSAKRPLFSLAILKNGASDIC